MNTPKTIVVNLMVPHRFTLPLLETYGCHIKVGELTISSLHREEIVGDPTLSVVFPPGTRREEQLPPLPHARKYLITLPSGSILQECYYLDFHQSIVCEPPPLPRYW